MLVNEKYDIRPVMDDLNPEMFIGIFEAEEPEKSPQRQALTDDGYSLDTSVTDY